MQAAENDLNPFYYLDDDHDDFDAGRESRRNASEPMFAYASDLSGMFAKLRDHS